MSVEPGFVSGIVLAAGSSTRFRKDRPKQLLEFEGEPLIQRVVRTALESRLREVIVVLGHQADAVRRALPRQDLHVVVNPHHVKGKSTSLRVGLDALSSQATAALFLQADQPFLTSELLDRLVAAFELSGSSIVLPTHRGRRGSPVLFARALFSELAALRGDEGGRQIFRRHAGDIQEVELENELPLLDVDSEEDLQRLLGPAAAPESQSSA